MNDFSNNFLSSYNIFMNYYLKVGVKILLHQWSRQWEYPFVYSKIKKHINKLNKNFMETKILDAGSGITFFPFFITSKLDIELHCCDVDNNLVDINIKKINNNFDKDNMNFTLSNISRTPYKTEYFDIIYCISVLEHTENFENVIHEFYRILKPNGILIIIFDISLDGISEISIEKSKQLLETILNNFEPDEENFEPLSEFKSLNNKTKNNYNTKCL